MFPSRHMPLPQLFNDAPQLSLVVRRKIGLLILRINIQHVDGSGRRGEIVNHTNTGTLSPTRTSPAGLANSTSARNHRMRKARWGRPGRGKRAGVRVIYYFAST